MIKSFGRELNNPFQEKYMDFVDNSFTIGQNISQVQAIFSGTAGFFPQMATVLILYFGVVFVLEKELTTGMLTSFVFLLILTI